MPKLWSDTIDAHRQQVREAILSATAQLVAERGLAAVSMSHIADAAGIGRATLYKYFTDVQTIISTWHAGQIEAHLAELTTLARTRLDPRDRLYSVMRAYAQIQAHRGGHEPELNAMLHQGHELAEAQQQLAALFTEVLSTAAQHGLVRHDIPADELATYCLHALSAGSRLATHDAIDRLVEVTLGGLQGRAGGPSRQRGRRSST